MVRSRSLVVLILTSIFSYIKITPFRSLLKDWIYYLNPYQSHLPRLGGPYHTSPPWKAQRVWEKLTEKCQKEEAFLVMGLWPSLPTWGGDNWPFKLLFLYLDRETNSRKMGVGGPWLWARYQLQRPGCVALLPHFPPGEVWLWTGRPDMAAGEHGSHLSSGHRRSLTISSPGSGYFIPWWELKGPLILQIVDCHFNGFPGCACLYLGAWVEVLLEREREIEIE